MGSMFAYRHVWGRKLRGRTCPESRQTGSGSIGGSYGSILSYPINEIHVHLVPDWSGGIQYVHGSRGHQRGSANQGLFIEIEFGMVMSIVQVTSFVIRADEEITTR